MVNEMLLWFARLPTSLFISLSGVPYEPLVSPRSPSRSITVILDRGLDHTTSFEVPEGQRHSGSLHAEHHRQKLVC